MEGMNRPIFTKTLWGHRKDEKSFFLENRERLQIAEPTQHLVDW